MKYIAFYGTKTKKPTAKYFSTPFEKSKDWIISDTIQEKNCYVFVIGLGGCNDKDVLNTRTGRCSRVICLDNNPFGYNWYNGVSDNDLMYMINIGSYIFSLSNDIPVWQPNRWDVLANKYGFPTPHSWKRTNEGSVVVMLPKYNGWIYNRTKWINTITEVINEISQFVPKNEINLRPHPRDYTLNINSILNIKDIAVKHGPIQYEAIHTKAVITLWSSGFVQFVMYDGCPVFDMSLSKDSMATLIADPDISHLKNLNDYTSPISPKDFLNTISQRVFTKSDYEDDTFLDYINKHI